MERFVSPKRKVEEDQGQENRAPETPKFEVSPKRKSEFNDQGGSSSKRPNRSKMATPKFKKPSPMRPIPLPKGFFDNGIDYDVPSPVKTPEEMKKVGLPELHPPPPTPPIQRDKRTKENMEPEHQPPQKKFKKGMFLG